MPGEIIASRDMLARLVAFDTTSSKSNMALIDDVRGYLAGHGVASHLVPNADGTKANLYATIGPSVAGGVVLSGHSDVVPITGQPWDTDPWTTIERDGKLYGRGTADMKCFIAVALALTPEFLKRELKVPIHLAISYDEEIGCLGAWPLADSIKANLPAPHAIIVGEPTMMKVVHAHKASTSYYTEFFGREAHSSQQQQGVSANHFAGELLYFLNRLAERFQARHPGPSDFIPPYGTVNVGIVNGGTAGNIIARHCLVQWEYRSLPGEDTGEALALVRDFCDTVLLPKMRATWADARIETRQRAAAPPLRPDPDSKAEHLCRQLTGDNRATSVSYAAEAGIFQQAGFSVVLCGPGDIAQAHQPNEFIAIEQIGACEAFLRKLGDWAAGARP